MISIIGGGIGGLSLANALQSFGINFKLYEQASAFTDVGAGISKVNLDLVFKSNYIEFWGDNLRFATIPISEESYYWYAVKESKEGEVDNQLSIKQDLSILFGDFHPSIRRVIENGNCKRSF